MRTLRLIFKLLPVIGDFIQNVKETEEKDADYWIATISDLVRTIITVLISMKIISGDLNLLQLL
jgi:hypothetical protein